MAIQKITSSDIVSISNTSFTGTVTSIQLDAGSASGNGSIAIPTGTTAQRPTNPNVGMQRFNTTNAAMETYNGSAWVGLGGLTLQSVQTSNFTAIAGNMYPANTTNSSLTTITLPVNPTAGDQIGIFDYAGTFNTNNLILSAGNNKINGLIAPATLSTNRESVYLTYIDSTQGWLLTSGFNTSTPTFGYIANYIIVAGGGGAAGQASSGACAGGGAGGVLSGTTTLTVGSKYSFVVGGGGGSSPGNSNGTQGSNSTGFSLSAIGGGYGGNDTGGSGGSGGGGGTNNGSAGSGTPGQGYPGGSGSTDSSTYRSAGAGGGAGATGQSGSKPAGSNGGIGIQSSITGTNTYYGGGGGAAYGGLGGLGGGGNAGNPGASGTANSGGGGGGSGNAGSGPNGSGGSGVVIISIPTAFYTANTTGTPTVTTVGSNKVLTFTSSGSYTA